MPAPRRPDDEPSIGVLVGATATGKSELAVAVAERIGAEILAADSRQVYRGLEIGTAKPPPGARRRVAHHLIDLVAPDEAFSVADWTRLARASIAEVAGRAALPLVVGGTGLYVASLLDGYDYGWAAPSPEIRRRLWARLELEGLDSIATSLVQLSPEVAAGTDLRNPRRVVRALERLEAGGLLPGGTPYAGRVVRIGLHRQPEILDRRIGSRTRSMFDAGLIDETRALLAEGYDPARPALSGIGYAEVARHLAGGWSLGETIEAIVRRTRQYAKRQLTWFRRDPRIVWIDAGDRPAADARLVDEVCRLLYRAVE